MTETILDERTLESRVRLLLEVGRNITRGLAANDGISVDMELTMLKFDQDKIPEERRKDYFSIPKKRRLAYEWLEKKRLITTTVTCTRTFPHEAPLNGLYYTIGEKMDDIPLHKIHLTKRGRKLYEQAEEAYGRFLEELSPNIT